MQSIKKSGAFLVTTLMLVLLGETVVAQASSSRTPIVIELFTSQGCSSCPPADTLLGELAERPDVIALAFHVDYWDSLGWRDAFALPLSSQRQQQYGQTLQLRTIFTPQAIVDGHRSVLGSDRHAMLAVINAHRQAIPIKLAVVNSELVIGLGDLPGSNHVDVNVVSYMQQASTAIGRGENTGHVLKEFNIVRSFKQLDSWNGRARSYYVPLSSLPTDASHVAVMLQQPGQGQVIGATAITIR